MQVKKINALWRVSGNILIIILLSAACAFLLWFHRIWPSQFQVGQNSAVYLINHKEQIILDEAATAQRRNQNKKQIVNNFLQNPEFIRNDLHNQTSIRNLKNNIKSLDKLLSEPSSSPKLSPEKLAPYLLIVQNSESFSKESWQKIRKQAPQIAERLLKYGYLGSVNLQTLKLLTTKNYKPTELNLLKSLLENSLMPNLQIKVEALQKLEKEATNKTRMVWKTLPADTVILKPGELITPAKFSTIQQLNLNQRSINWKAFQEAFGMTLLVIISFYLYIRLEKFQIGLSQTFLLCLLTMSASAFVGFFTYQKPLLLPLAAVAMISALFFKPTIGLSAGILFGILSIQALQMNATLALPSFVGCIMGILLSQKAKNRADLARAGFWLGLGQIITLILVSVLFKNIHIEPHQFLSQGLAGLATALMVSSFMPYLEYLFGVVTRFRLQELADPNQQTLLQKLHEEAPGTYEHTLVVADLAQDAAKKIEADSELVRVGILYHDIGKLYNPQIFIENQFGSSNPHDKLTPKQSALAIIAHVAEGIKLARKYKLPASITSFIPAHQGTSRAGHFFTKACQEDLSLKDDTAFRYPGPIPDSKETGIAMLADTVEATIRSLKTSDISLVRATINKLIQIRLEDGQLVNSQLSPEELAKIAESFLESWKNKNHERIKYLGDFKDSNL